MNSALQGSDVKFDAKFNGTHNNWSVSMHFVGKNGSTYTINVYHIETASGDKYETLKAGGNKKGGDDYYDVEELGSDLAHRLSDKLRIDEADEQKKEVENFRQGYDNSKQQMEQRHEKIRERLHQLSER